MTENLKAAQSPVIAPAGTERSHQEVSTAEFPIGGANRPRLSLPLFVARICGTDHVVPTFPPDELTMLADLFDACTDLHLSSLHDNGTRTVQLDGPLKNPKQSSISDAIDSIQVSQQTNSQEMSVRRN